MGGRILGKLRQVRSYCVLSESGPAESSAEPVSNFDLIKI